MDFTDNDYDMEHMLFMRGVDSNKQAGPLCDDLIIHHHQMLLSGLNELKAEECLKFRCMHLDIVHLLCFRFELYNGIGSLNMKCVGFFMWPASNCTLAPCGPHARPRTLLKLAWWSANQFQNEPDPVSSHAYLGRWPKAALPERYRR